jgi:cytochrome c oxidase subunit 3
MDIIQRNQLWTNLKLKHPFHLVKPSGWPMLFSFNLLYFILVFVTYGMNHGKLELAGQLSASSDSAFLAFICKSSLITMFLESFVSCSATIFIHKILSLFFIVIMGAWFWDVIVEGTYEGHHTKMVQRGLRYGMILFIVSEVMFFFGLFWAFFHSSLSPNIEIGAVWPPKGIIPFDPWKIPLLNTIILLTSGASITWAHHALVAGNRSEVTDGLLLTVMLGGIFSVFQAYEYAHAFFTIKDTVYGSVFYLATGFHGFHVIIGTLFLAVCLWRHLNYHFTNTHHFGFEAAAWYWHFVDVVWLFLFISIYWWGS